MFKRNLVLALSLQNVEIHFILHAPLIKPRLWHIFFLHCPFPNLDGGNNRLSERLSVLLLHHRFHIWAIDVSR